MTLNEMVIIPVMTACNVCTNVSQVYTCFMYNLMNAPNISMASSVVEICPVMIIAWRWPPITVDIVC